MKDLNRREWIISASAMGLFGACNSPKEDKPLVEPTIVDAHVHVWSSDFRRYPLAPGFEPTDLWIPSYSVERLIREGKPAGIGKTNLIQMTWYGLDHSYILDIIAKDPKHFVGTGIVPAVTDVSLPSPDKTMIALSKKGIYAFRVRGGTTRPPLGGGPQWMDHPGFDMMFKAAAEHNLALSFLMSINDLPEPVSYTHLTLPTILRV